MCSGRLALAIALVLLSIPSASAQNAQDYRQWRGQHRDGAASAFDAPGTWPAALTARWRVEVGEGYATPLIAGDTVFVFSRVDGQEGLTASRPRRTLWVGSPRAVENTALVTAGDLLFLLNGAGELIVARASREGFAAASADVVRPNLIGSRRECIGC